MWFVALLAVSLAGEADLLRMEWARVPAAELVAAPARSPHQRAVKARALGRLRAADAVGALTTLAADRDADVRIAAAEALGYTPGGAAPLRDRLAIEADERARAVLAEALGHAGDASDTAALVAALGEGGDTTRGAAQALGRLGKRGEDVSAAVVPLVALLDAIDPRTVEDAAWALRRIGLSTADARTVGRLAERWDRLPDGPARASLLTALWPRTEDHRALFERALRAPEPVVRTAALDAVQEGQVPADVVAAALVDDHPWVRAAAIHALGRLGATDSVRTLLFDPATAVLAAEVLASRGVDPRVPADAPPAVVAAAVGAHLGVEPLVTLARDAPAGAVRTAAAGALLELEAPVGARLMTASDPAVREAGLELLGERPDLSAVLKLARTETNPDVLAGLLALLVDSPASVRADPLLPDVIARTATVGPRPARVAARLAAATGQAPPPATPAPELAVGADVSTLRSAVVRTSRGEFVLALYPDTAPVAVWTFATLASSGYFDGLAFHRVVPGFVAQTGCPRGDGWGGPGFTIPDEVSMRPFDRGAVGMARADRDTGGSQWFVTVEPQPHLEGDYTLFGHVVRGMEVVRRLERGDTLLSVTVEPVP